MKSVNSARENSQELIQDFWGENHWDWCKLSEDLPTQIAAKIFMIPPNLDSQAQPVWKLSSDGQFTTKSAWELVRQRSRLNPVLDKCWTSRIPATIAIFGWKVLHHWLPVDETLQRRGIILASR